MRDLSGQVAWITGAGTGIGESAALKLASGVERPLARTKSAPYRSMPLLG